MIGNKIITQLSIFVNNEPGKLASVTKTINSVGVKIKAFNLAESTEFGILRAIVEEPEASYEKLKAQGVVVKKTDIIAIRVIDAADSLNRASEILGNDGINIEYGYFYPAESGKVLFIRVDDVVKAVEALEKADITLLDDGDL